MTKKYFKISKFSNILRIKSESNHLLKSENKNQYKDNITAFNVNKNLFQSDVPIVIGINADEPVSFLNFLLKKPMDVHIYHAALDLLFRWIDLTSGLKENNRKCW